MIIRLRSKKGTDRVEIAENATAAQFLSKVKEELKLPEQGWSISKQPDGSLPISHRTNQLNIKHGDMLYLVIESDKSSQANGTIKSSSSSSSSSSLASTSVPSSASAVSSNGEILVDQSSKETVVVEDEVDQKLDKMDGLIRRKRDARLCKHGEKGMCDYCCPIEPYDPKYLETNNIKHISFHSFLKKLRRGADAGKFAALEEPYCAIKPGCSGHSPWPAGICTKCQPSAVTLNRQVYRHVDYAEFESPQILDRFIQSWRQSGGAQRIGFMYGRYDVHTETPLGIKAVVAAIYEPPQIDSPDSLELLMDPNEAVVNQVASHLGLSPVGWIFTDLEDDGTGTGGVQYKRHKESMFLSAGEIMMAADLQNSHPNPCKMSSQGRFGSKFVTVCVSGDSNHGVAVQSYQVSNQGMALVRHACVVPSTRVPSLMKVKMSTDAQYVPDVFYSYKNEYGTEVTVSARPSFPVDYLLVNVANGSPQVPTPTFNFGSEQPFPVENRSSQMEIADLAALKRFLKQRKDSIPFFALMSDFHLLIFLATCGMFDLNHTLPHLFKAVRYRDSESASVFLESAEWKNALAILDAIDGAVVSSEQMFKSNAGNGKVKSWACSHCTFINANNTTGNCEVCGLPQ